MKSVPLRILWVLVAVLAIHPAVRPDAGEPPGFVRPPLVLAAPEPTPDGVRLGWSVPGDGWRFGIESRGDLASGAWLPATDVTLEGRVWTDPRPIGGSRWYRVRTGLPEVARGEVLEVTEVTRFSRLLLRAIFLGAGIDVYPRFDVRFLRVVYRTVDPYGLPTTASGGLAVPAGADADLPLVSYQHGTVLERSDVPSAVNTEGLVGLAFAADGYVAAMPDYLGLGVSPGFHPYHLARSAATSVVDLLRAARGVCAGEGVGLDGRLFLIGYSQGGHATAAAHRELEARHADEFTVTAAAPMAGALDLSGTALDDALSDRIPPNPYYFAYILAAYVEYYRFVPSLASVLRPPYDTRVPPLLDGATSSGTVNAALPATPRDALAPDFLSAVANDPAHPLRIALGENDLLDWAPRAPVRIFHCAGDRDVPPRHSVVAVERWRAAGAAAVELFDPAPFASHGACAVHSMLAAKAWFDELRAAAPGSRPASPDP